MGRVTKSGGRVKGLRTSCYVVILSVIWLFRFFCSFGL